MLAPMGAGGGGIGMPGGGQLQQTNRRDSRAFYDICAERGPEGVTQDELVQNGWDTQSILQCVNQLSNDRLIQFSKLPGGKLLYRAVDQEQHRKFGDLDDQSMAVYQAVKKSGDRGIWSKALKDQLKLQAHTLSKITKDLLRRNLIKEVKCVQHKNRKVFMASDVTPAHELTGGSWYQDGELASNWIEQLRQLCQEFLLQNSGRTVTLQEVTEYVVQQPCQSVPDENNIAEILRTLELDEDIYSVQRPNGEMHYTLRNQGVGKEQQPDLFGGRVPDVIMRLPASNRPVESSGCDVPCMRCPMRD